MEDYTVIENPWVGTFVDADVWSHTENILMGKAPRDYLEAHGCLPEDIDAALSDQLRGERDNLLVEVDAFVGNPLRWATLSAEQQGAWADYRQALLDVPQQAGFPNDVVWPVKP